MNVRSGIRLAWTLVLVIPIPYVSAEDESINRWCDEAISEIVAELSEEDREVLRSIEQRKELLEFERGWGMGIRNRFQLWDSDSKYYRSCSFKFGLVDISPTEKDESGLPKLVPFGDPEGISADMMQVVWEQVRGEP